MQALKILLVTSALRAAKQVIKSSESYSIIFLGLALSFVRQVLKNIN